MKKEIERIEFKPLEPELFDLEEGEIFRPLSYGRNDIFFYCLDSNGQHNAINIFRPEDKRLFKNDMKTTPLQIVAIEVKEK